MKNKRPKLKQARRMMTPNERRMCISPFSCASWNKRSDSIKKRLKKKNK